MSERVNNYSEAITCLAYSCFNDDGISSDPNLLESVFHIGRYILLSSSRGFLPANLQGLWNNSQSPEWGSDYHTNINLQMTYWPAEVTNLSETHLPYLNFIQAQAPALRIATQKKYGANVPGWTSRTSQSPFGGNSWEWNAPANGWAALHLYEHWAYTKDENYLKNFAYPIEKEVVQFWLHQLIVDSNGSLVAPKGWSPEHGPKANGVMYEQQIISNLFENYLEMAKALRADLDLQAQVTEAHKKLAPNKIGRWGQLQEWQEDIDVREGDNDPHGLGWDHRHTSHLWAVYPGNQINPFSTPDFAKAAGVSLLGRGIAGDIYHEWPWPWRTAIWARLQDHTKAYGHLQGFIGHNMFAANLLGAYNKGRSVPIQLDGISMTGAMAEMLLQSYNGVINILPALPAQWPDGNYSGLRARGGYTVDVSWNKGKINSYRIVSDTPVKEGSTVKVRLQNGDVIDVVPQNKDN